MADGTVPAQAPFAERIAPPHWRTVDLLSDLHLQAGERATFALWRRYLQDTPADALFILGDLFEVWVGDDAADAASEADAADPPGFERECAEALRAAAARIPVHFMRGNRDFLLGADFAARTGLQLLDDPTLLHLHGRRWLLSHGDLLCLADTDYLAFRAQVRTPQWQAAFLAQPLAQRRVLAREIRARSEMHKASSPSAWADVDDEAARQWLRHAQAEVLVHGHTHRPAEHALGGGLRRLVLSDWDAAARPPRAQVLRLTPAHGAQRIDLAAA